MAMTLRRVDDEPIAMSSRVFKTDNGWYYELKIWQGDVDTTTASPTIVFPPKPFRSKKGAAQALVYAIAVPLKVRIPGI